MKTTRMFAVSRFSGLVVTLALFAGVAGETRAQEKGATRLLRLSGTLVDSKAEANGYKPMSCAKCKDQWVSVRNTEAKGSQVLASGGAPTRTVASHLCDACSNGWVIAGHGKAKEAIASHKCTSCGAESLACCNTNKGSDVTTKGMEKKFEVAPLK